MNLRQRIARLERRQPGATGYLEVAVRGGFVHEDGDVAAAPGTGLAWQRQRGETEAAFRARARAEARAARAFVLIFGGLSE